MKESGQIETVSVVKYPIRNLCTIEESLFKFFGRFIIGILIKSTKRFTLITHVFPWELIELFSDYQIL